MVQTPHFLGSKRFSSLAHWIPPLPATPSSPPPTPSSGHGTPQTGAIVLPLPKLSISSWSLFGTGHHQPHPSSLHFSSTFSCLMSQSKSCLTSQVWRCILNDGQIHLTLIDTSRAQPSLTFAWAVAITLHLVLLTHFMTLKSIPDPVRGPRGPDEGLTVRARGWYITSTLWNM